MCVPVYVSEYVVSLEWYVMNVTSMYNTTSADFYIINVNAPEATNAFAITIIV